MRLALIGALAVGLAACSTPRVASSSDASPTANPTRASSAEAVEAGVRAMLAAQVAAWNAGSVRGFMDGYVRSDSLTFLSGGSVRRGYEEALYAYLRTYPDADAMGTLSFDAVTVRPLAPGRALAWGRWRLERAGDAPGGLFTLVVAETPEGWRVMHDHTSSD